MTRGTGEKEIREGLGRHLDTSIVTSAVTFILTHSFVHLFLVCFLFIAEHVTRRPGYTTGIRNESNNSLTFHITPSARAR